MAIWVGNVLATDIGKKFSLVKGVVVGEPVAFANGEDDPETLKARKIDAGYVGMYRIDGPAKQSRKATWLGNVCKSDIGVEFSLVSGVTIGDPVAFANGTESTNALKSRLMDAGVVGLYRSSQSAAKIPTREAA